MRKRTYRQFAAAACLAVVVATAVGSDEKVVEHDRWYTALLQSKPVGWMHATVVRRGDRIEMRVQTHITLRRGQTALDLVISETFIETVAGQPVEATMVQKLAGPPVVTKLRFGDGEHVLTTTQDGRTRRRTVSADKEPWLTPAAAERYVEQQLDQGAKQISYRMISLSAGHQPIEVTHTIVGPTQVQVMGKVVAAVERRTVTSIMPGTATTEYVDAEGLLLKMAVDVGIMKIELVAADKQLARAQIDPPQLMAQMLIKAAKPIGEPRKLRTAVYELGVAGDGELDLPDLGYQRVVKSDGRTARLRVDMDKASNVDDKDRPGPEHRQASIMIDSEDPLIVKLAEQAAGTEKSSDRRTAEALCHFVHHYVTGCDLSVGFATASEVAQTKAGDCSEFAVLLAAMLRARGIPSRTVSGITYVRRFVGHENLFGYHMWTQAWIGDQDTGQWVDLDAALNGDDRDRFDAAHIALATSAWADGGQVNDMLKLAPLLGRISIDVVSTSYGR